MSDSNERIKFVMPVPGEKYKLFYDKDSPNNMIIHIRAIVDDDFVVFRTWSKNKKDWRYHVEYHCWFTERIDNLKKV